MQRAAGAPVAAFGGGAEEHHGAGGFLEDVGEILGAHHRRGHLEPCVVAEGLPGHAAGEGMGAAVADRDREARNDLEVGLAEVGGADVVHHALEPLTGDGAGFFREGSDRAFDESGLGNDVVGRARPDVRDGQHGGIEGGNAAGDHGLQRHHHLAGDGDGVDRVVRLRGVAALAPDGEFDPVGGGEQGAGSSREDARLDVWRDVECEGGIGDRVDQAIIKHVARAVPAFLAGLEHELHRAGETVALGAEGVGRRHEHGDVRVVSAGVHRVLDLRGEFEAGVLVHRQRVHVAAEEDGAAVGGSTQGGDEARGGGAFRILQRQAGESGLRLGGGQRIVQADLGFGMDGAAQADHLGQQRVGGVDPVLHGFRFCHLGSSFRASIEYSGRERNRSFRKGPVFDPGGAKIGLICAGAR